MGQEQSRAVKPISPTGAAVTLAVGAGVAAAVALYSFFSEDESSQTVTNQAHQTDEHEFNTERFSPRDLNSKINDFAILVFNLPADVHETELRNKFERIGCRVYSSKQILDHEGNFSGTFSIKMEDEVSVQLALRLNGKTFKNKTVHIVRTSDLQLHPNENDSNQTQMTDSTEITESLKEGECKVCFERNMDAVFVPCGHVAACFSCASKMTLCPICRTDVDRVVRLYFS